MITTSRQTTGFGHDGNLLADDGCQERGIGSQDPFLGDLPKVEAAALHSQTLDEAPANVTIITRAQIRTYGYRTLGEALAGVRGFYMTRDHIYSYAGVSGFSLPGDFNTRFLVMINGHSMTDNVYSSNGFFEQDFGLDLDLVERIEVVRGPSSALYGSNGIFATINIVTISPVDFSTLYATAEAGSFGEKKAMLAGSFYLGKGANLLVSASGVNNAGEDYYFPELNGTAINMDGERAYHTFANLVWRNWNIVAYFNDRLKKVPLAWNYDANSFSSRGNYAEDSRNYVSAVYRRTAGPGDLRWETSYDQYRYDDRFDTVTSNGIYDHHTYADGDWLTLRLSYQFPARGLGSLTAGLEASADLRNWQHDMQIQPVELLLLSVNRRSRAFGVFLQDEKRLSAHWKLDLGARLDIHRYYGSSFSPRAVLAYQPTARTVYKFIYGRAFRDPNAYEQFYYDGVDSLQPPPLKPETANTFEILAEHHFKPGLSGTIHLYDYRIKNLIQAVYADDGASTFENLEGARSQGIELELGGKPRPWMEADGSFAWQKAGPKANSTSFANSPAYLAKFRWAIPAGRRFTVANSFQWTSSRGTYDGEVVRAVALVDVTLTVRRLPFGCDLQLGVRNALNWSYKDPVALSLDELQGDPRTAYVKLIWNSRR